jgi:hypothetical protein
VDAVDDLQVRTRVNETGFAIEIEGPSGTEFSLQFFAVGAGGYFTSGEVTGKLPEARHYAYVHELPFPVLEAGITDLALGGSAGAFRMDDATSAVGLPFNWSDRFDGRNIPNMPISAGGDRE